MWRAAVAIIALWAPGCVADEGGGTSDAGEPGDGPMAGPVAGGGAPAAHRRQVAELLCEAHSRCCGGGAEARTACVDTLADDESAAIYDRAFELGLARFDESRAATCLRAIDAALGAADCESNVLETALGSETVRRRCEAVEEGLVPPGGVCAYSTDASESATITISSDSFCRGELLCVLGRCGPPAARGEPCDFSDDCRPELYCGDETEICTERVQSGEGCDDSDACVAGLVCFSEEERCGPPRSNGEVCSRSRDCASRHCTDEGRCEAASAEDACQ